MSQTDSEKSVGYIPRATRFPIKLPVHYRESGSLVWREGGTTNISRTGVLFKAEQYLPLQTPLEMRIAFPSPLKVTLVCRGHVVRTQVPVFPETRPSLAIPIRRSRLLREGRIVGESV
jgi:hypothetical protein